MHWLSLCLHTTFSPADPASVGGARDPARDAAVRDIITADRSTVPRQDAKIDAVPTHEYCGPGVDNVQERDGKGPGQGVADGVEGQIQAQHTQGKADGAQRRAEGREAMTREEEPRWKGE